MSNKRNAESKLMQEFLGAEAGADDSDPLNALEGEDSDLEYGDGKLSGITFFEHQARKMTSLEASRTETMNKLIATRQDIRKRQATLPFVALMMAHRKPESAYNLETMAHIRAHLENPTKKSISPEDISKWTDLIGREMLQINQHVIEALRQDKSPQTCAHVATLLQNAILSTSRLKGQDFQTELEARVKSVYMHVRNWQTASKEDKARIEAQFLRRTGQHPSELQQPLEELERLYKLEQFQSNRVIEANLLLVIKPARKASRMTGVREEDLQQEGAIGLQRALKKFVPEAGYNFSTYAMSWIKQTIERYAMDVMGDVRMPIHRHRDMGKIKSSQRQIFNQTGRDATIRELCEATGLPRKKIESLPFNGTREISRDDYLEDNPEHDLSEVLDAEITQGETRLWYEDPLKTIERMSLQKQISLYLDTLKGDRLRDVMNKRFGFDESEDSMTLEELSKIHGVTRERIRQLELQGKRTLEKRVPRTFRLDLD